jgi:hypothetical protein
MSSALLFSLVLLPSFGGGSAATARQFEALDRQMTAAGLPIDQAGPVITDAPIWLPYVAGGTALALPFEPPESVIDLARHFQASVVVVTTGEHPLRASLEAGALGSDCFQPVDIGRPADADLARALDGTRVYRLVCQ